jgi:hypothetical protein
MALRCYALDVAAEPLLLNGTHTDLNGKTKAEYEELYSTELLSLAIALRTLFYQGMDPKGSASFVAASGLLYRYNSLAEETVPFTVKDVCDKIIHATTISKHLERGIANSATMLEGAETRGTSWQLSFSVTLFVEGLLEWLNTQEDMQ